MTQYALGFVNISFDIFKDLLIIGIILFLNFIFTICAMFAINQDAQKRKTKCWHWNLIIFLLSLSLLSFIPVIFYIVLVCNKKPIIENNSVIDTRLNDNNGNNKNTSENNIPNTNNVNSTAKIITSYPKFIFFYAIIQFISFCISISALINIMDEAFDMIKYSYVNYQNIETFQDHRTAKYDDIQFFEEYNNNQYSQGNLNNFDFQNIKTSKDIKDYANQIFISASDKIINSIQANNNFAIFNTFDAYLSNPTGNDIAQFFFNNLITYEFAYSNENQGILQVTPNFSNLTVSDINSLKAKSLSNFYSKNLNCVLLISQNINGLTLNKVIKTNIDDFKTFNLNKYNLVKGYPVYISFYSNILSDNYELGVTLL